MATSNRRVVLIVGASSSIGLACAEMLHQRGDSVYGASRDWSKRADVPFHQITWTSRRMICARRSV
jgi:NAD(P)-dependent dehydrogenase (short-subunit alcohol dehydrogenase family)